MTRLEDCDHRWISVTTLSDKAPVAKCAKCKATRYGHFEDADDDVPDPPQPPPARRLSDDFELDWRIVVAAVVFAVFYAVSLWMQ